MPRSPGFAPPLNELGKTGLGAPYVARSATGGMGLALDDKGKVPVAVMPNMELDRAQRTTNVTFTATSEGTATAIITGNPVVYDGATVEIEFWTPLTYHSVSTAYNKFVVLRGSTVVGQAHWSGTGNGAAFPLRMRDTPTAGEHTYAVKAFVDSGTGTVAAGAGGAGNLAPAFLRVTRA